MASRSRRAQATSHPARSIPISWPDHPPRRRRLGAGPGAVGNADTAALSARLGPRQRRDQHLQCWQLALAALAGPRASLSCAARCLLGAGERQKPVWFALVHDGPIFFAGIAHARPGFDAIGFGFVAGGDTGAGVRIDGGDRLWLAAQSRIELLFDARRSCSYPDMRRERGSGR